MSLSNIRPSRYFSSWFVPPCWNQVVVMRGRWAAQKSNKSVGFIRRIGKYMCSIDGSMWALVRMLEIHSETGPRTLFAASQAAQVQERRVTYIATPSTLEEKEEEENPGRSMVAEKNLYDSVPIPAGLGNGVQLNLFLVCGANGPGRSHALSDHEGYHQECKHSNKQIWSLCLHERALKYMYMYIL